MFARDNNLEALRDDRRAPRTPLEVTRTTPSYQLDELKSTLSSASRYLPDEMQHFAKALGSPSVRDPVLAVVLTDPQLMRDPKHRVGLLNSLIRFSDEPLIQTFATQTLAEPAYRENLEVVRAASTVIVSAGERLTAPNITTLADVAIARSHSSESLASHTARYLIDTLPPAVVSPEPLQTLARAWYLHRRGEPNPWLSTISRVPSIKRVAILQEILTGNVPYEGKPSLLERALTFPIDLHHTAVTSGLVGIVFNKALPLLGIGRGISSLGAFVMASTIVYGAKSLANAVSMDTVNADREPERIEVVRHLQTIHEHALERSGRAERAAGRAAYIALRIASRSLLQEPVVRAEARAAIEEIYRLERAFPVSPRFGAE